MRPRTNPPCYVVLCKTCGAMPGGYCIGKGGGRVEPHKARVSYWRMMHGQGERKG